jgi:hypothetical protein
MRGEARGVHGSLAPYRQFPKPLDRRTVAGAYLWSLSLRKDLPRRVRASRPPPRKKYSSDLFLRRVSDCPSMKISGYKTDGMERRNNIVDAEDLSHEREMLTAEWV